MFVIFQNSKVRRFAFELKMQDKSTYLLAADSEAEMEEWITILNKILHSCFEQAMQEKRNGDLHDGVFSQASFSSVRHTASAIAAQSHLHVLVWLPYSVYFLMCLLLFILYL